MANRINDDNIIKALIKSNKPFFIGRIAGCELELARIIVELENSILIPHYVEQVEVNAGIYMKDNNSLLEYSRQLIHSYTKCSAIGIWERDGEVFKETGRAQKYIEDKTPKIPKLLAQSLEPYYTENSWMDELSGKKLLIIHPFVKSFSQQVTNMKHLFPNRHWFENCTFSFLEPPITLAGNHNGKDWQEHLDEFKEKLSEQKDFDIALVACGGYGMLVSEYIYEKKKSVIYIGGALQLFFGVIGKRWCTDKKILSLVNDHWVRPSKDEKPPNYQKIEKGCYW
jgi:hypothetical protein